MGSVDTIMKHYFKITVFAQWESKVTFCDGEFIGITSERMESRNYSNDETPVLKNTTITIDYLDVHEDVNMSGAISTADGDVDFHFTGDLYVSEKQAPSEIDFYDNYVNEEKSVAPCIISYDSEEKQMVGTRSTHSYSKAGKGWYTKEVVESWY